MKRTKRITNLPKMTREQVLDAAKLTNPEARFIVANYYAEQDSRKRADMQLRHLGGRDGRPALLQYTADCHAEQEKSVLRMLEQFAAGHPVGRWMLAQMGIGPVIAAGLIANVDITQAPTVGHVWRFAGQDPTCKWEKGQKRPFNPDLKQLVYHMGECFKRVGDKADNFYGAIYRSRKALLVKRNDAGFNAERAKTFVTKSAEWKKILREGKLPDGNLDRQACNYAAKIFLSHMHALMYWNHFGAAPPKPFAITIMGHAHEIVIPQHNMFPGFSESYYHMPTAKVEELHKKKRTPAPKLKRVARSRKAA